MTDNRTTEKLMREFVAVACECEVRDYLISEYAERIEQAIVATLGNGREAKLIRAMEDVLRHATDTVWVSEIETLVDRMVSLGVYGCEVYEGARPWEVD